MTSALRVLHIASGDLWAGAEAQAWTLITHLARIPDTDVAAVVMNPGTLADKLCSAGISVHVLNEQKSSSLELWIQLRGVLREWRPDVVHTHREKENILGSLAAHSRGNVPSVRTVHGGQEHSAVSGYSGVRRRLTTRLDRWCGRTLQQRIIAVTRELGVRLSQEFPANKIAVIENGVDAEEVRRSAGVAEFRAAEPEATHIGIAGRLVAVKRVDLFIETAALLSHESPQRRWKFHIFGEGPMRARLETLADQCRLRDQVIFHGHRSDIATCVGGLDALVMCSDHEGMPMIALEAAALGIPTVAHAVGGLIDVVPQEFLVVRHDAPGYRDGILRALGADGRALAKTRAAETVVRYSAARNAEKVRALYEELMAARDGEWTERSRAGETGRGPRQGNG